MKAPSWRRAVLKVGSALIAPDETGVSTKYLLPIARFINECRERGQEVVLVSSGSVASGRKHHNETGRSASRSMQAGPRWRNSFALPAARTP